MLSALARRPSPTSLRQSFIKFYAESDAQWAGSRGDPRAVSAAGAGNSSVLRNGHKYSLQDGTRRGTYMSRPMLLINPFVY